MLLTWVQAPPLFTHSFFGRHLATARFWFTARSVKQQKRAQYEHPKSKRLIPFGLWTLDWLQQPGRLSHLATDRAEQLDSMLHCAVDSPKQVNSHAIHTYSRWTLQLNRHCKTETIWLECCTCYYGANQAVQAKTLSTYVTLHDSHVWHQPCEYPKHCRSLYEWHIHCIY